MTDSPANLATGRDNRYEWEEFVSHILDRLAALEAGGGPAKALHYGVAAGQTLASAPVSESWFPDLAALNDEPIAAADSTNWATDFNWVDQPPPQVAVLPRGLYAGYIEGNVIGDVTPTAGSVHVSFQPLSESAYPGTYRTGTVGRVSRMGIDGLIGVSKELLPVPIDGAEFALEVDLTDGTNVQVNIQITLVKIGEMADI